LSFLTAVRFLTIFPMPGVKEKSLENLGSSLPYFPLVGLFLGVILAVLTYALELVLPLPVVSILLVIALVIMTGAHHIDGLIDTCDAMVAGKTREQRLQIMSDTRIGAFGIAGGCLILIAKYAVFYQAAGPVNFLIAPALSRWALVSAILLFPSAKDHGMGHAARGGAKRGGFILATVITVVLLVLLYGAVKGPLLIAALFLLICCICILFTRMFGGLTGDNYGALIETGEVLTLILMLILNSPRLAIPAVYIYRLPFA